MRPGEGALIGEFALARPSWMPLKTFSGKAVAEPGGDPLAHILASMEGVGGGTAGHRATGAAAGAGQLDRAGYSQGGRSPLAGGARRRGGLSAEWQRRLDRGCSLKAEEGR